VHRFAARARLAAKPRQLNVNVSYWFTDHVCQLQIKRAGWHGWSPIR
jgi:hypothetical protein